MGFRYSMRAKSPGESMFWEDLGLTPSWGARTFYVQGGGPDLWEPQPDVDLTLAVPGDGGDDRRESAIAAAAPRTASSGAAARATVRPGGCEWGPT